jgi:hypothetical protein
LYNPIFDLFLLFSGSGLSREELLAFNSLMLYNPNDMLLSPEILNVFLFLCIIGMAILAAFYLGRRELSPLEYLAWGALILFVPLLGPFLVILLHPGRPAGNKHESPHT